MKRTRKTLCIPPVRLDRHGLQGAFHLSGFHQDAATQTRLADLPDGRSKLAELLTIYLELSRGADGKLGCMVVSGIVDIDLVGLTTDRWRLQFRALEAALRKLITEGRSDGSIPLRVSKEAAATLLLAMLPLQGSLNARLGRALGSAFWAAGSRRLWPPCC